MEAFPWEVGDSSEVRATVTVAGRGDRCWSTCLSFLKLSINHSGASCTDIGSGYGWEMEVAAMEAPRVSTLVEVGSQLDLGLTDITKYSSYSKLWRMLYFINDAPFCIHTHGCTPAPGLATPTSGISTQDRTPTSSFIAFNRVAINMRICKNVAV